MSETRPGNRIDRDAVATLRHVAGLADDEERLDELTALFEAAGDAATHLDNAASRVPLNEALAEFDPAWPSAEGRA